MNIEEVILMVKSNVHGYESISLANDDVVRLLVVIKHLQDKKEIEVLKNGNKPKNATV